MRRSFNLDSFLAQCSTARFSICDSNARITKQNFLLMWNGIDPCKRDGMLHYLLPCFYSNSISFEGKTCLVLDGSRRDSNLICSFVLNYCRVIQLDRKICFRRERTTRMKELSEEWSRNVAVSVAIFYEPRPNSTVSDCFWIETVLCFWLGMTGCTLTICFWKDKAKLNA